MKWLHFDSRAALWLGGGEGLRSAGLAHYARRTPIKGPGRIRIGLFGPSIVGPYEVGLGEDLPAQLQSLFRENGHPEVEVLGFGAGAAAIQYSYFQWDLLGRWMDLDHVVLVLPRAEPGREANFGTFPRTHGRLVLDGDGLKKIETPARDSTATAWPSWSTLRYDSRMPKALKAFWKKEKWNPFYYHSDPTQEAEELSARIARLWSRETAHFSVYLPYPLGARLTLRLLHTNVPIFQSRLTGLDDIYWASRTHFSPLGNRLRAEELFRYLTGKDALEPTLLGARRDTAWNEGAPEWPTLSGEVPIWAGPNYLGNLTPPKPWKRFPVRAWIAVQPFRFIPIAQTVSADQTVWLEITHAGIPTRTEVGTLRRLHDGAAAVEWKSPPPASELGGQWALDPTPHLRLANRNTRPTLIVGALAQLPMKQGSWGWTLEHLEWRLLGRPRTPHLPVKAGLRLSARVATPDSIVEIPMPSVTTLRSPLWVFPSRYPWPLPSILATAGALPAP